jgi:hypothetical protein
LPTLVFPRLSRLEVTGYEPYVNDHGDGFDHPVLPGVNVIVGINGLGKTTLLNIIFRMLVGPFDPAKADRDRPGRKQAGLIRDRKFDFFRKRANDEAVDARATATFLFGDRPLRVTRSLYDLSLIEWALDGHSRSAVSDTVSGDEELMDILAVLMGFAVEESKLRGSDAYKYDFHFVVRNLIFFLEDKVPLIWNPDGQFVILRILLLKQELSDSISFARNELLKADSQYRNRLWAANLLRDQIKAQLADLPALTADEEQYGLYVSEVDARERALQDIREERSFYLKETERVENDVLRARADVFDAQVVLRREEAAFFHQAFHRIRTPGDVILQALESHEGCLVCGNRKEAAYDRARRLMDNHQCPVCEADTSIAGEGVADFGEAQKGRLKVAETRAEAQRQRLGRVEREAEELAAKYRHANDNYQETVTLLDQARRRRDGAESQVQRASHIRDLEKQLQDIDEQVAGLRSDLDALITCHEDLVKTSQDFIDRRSIAIIETFERYASAFMVEDCRLRFRRDRRAKVAQTDTPIDWPAFEVDLASGADAMPTERIDWHEVSESQKEFIDLAFRMALLSVASEGRASMLAVETPEASLDAFFVEKAGSLLRDYASTNSDNVLLVTSNLTREEMIAQLLGSRENAEDLDTRRRRTLNLLKFARPTKAYRLNSKFYDDKYDEAVGAPPALGAEEQADHDG